MIAAEAWGVAALDTSLTVWNSPSGPAQCGGGWCDAFALSEHVTALTIGDVSGHGENVAGAMAAMRAAVLRAIRQIRIPSEVLAVVNDVACTYGDGDGLIATAIVAIVDQHLGTLTSDAAERRARSTERGPAATCEHFRSRATSRACAVTARTTR